MAAFLVEPRWPLMRSGGVVTFGRSVARARQLGGRGESAAHFIAEYLGGALPAHSACAGGWTAAGSPAGLDGC